MFIIHIERYSDNETHNTEKEIEKKQNNHLKIRWLLIRLVGMARFELTTSCSQSRHSNRAELLPAAKASAKVQQFFELTKYFAKKMQKNAKKHIKNEI